jgi:hypothetical protein
MNDKALSNATLELTQRIQTHFPRDIDPAVVQFWNGQPKEILTARLLEAFGRIPAECVPQPQPLLIYGGTVAVAARTARFVPKNFFTTKNNRVRIGYVDPDFTAWFGGKAEEPTVATTLYWHVLSRPSAFAPAMKELGGGAVVQTTPSELASMMERQPDGPNSGAGPLLVNGYANLFEMLDYTGVSRMVRVFWSVGGWYVYANPVTNSNQWYDEYRFFSRNPR